MIDFLFYEDGRVKIVPLILFFAVFSLLFLIYVGFLDLSDKYEERNYCMAYSGEYDFSTRVCTWYDKESSEVISMPAYIIKNISEKRAQ